MRGVGGSSKLLGYEWGRNIPLLQCMIFLISSLHLMDIPWDNDNYE